MKNKYKFIIERLISFIPMNGGVLVGSITPEEAVEEIARLHKRQLSKMLVSFDRVAKSRNIPKEYSKPLRDIIVRVRDKY